MSKLWMDEDDSERNARLRDIFQTYREPVRRFFVRRTRNVTEADDLTQELFTRIVRKGNLENVDRPEGCKSLIHWCVSGPMRKSSAMSMVDIT